MITSVMYTTKSIKLQNFTLPILSKKSITQQHSISNCHQIICDNKFRMSS